ncbi:MAG: phage terminase large subunit, partial [Proteobacteria bacterium]|nr:phage terminase large subunit [Pseudomonadota bacterium]
MSTSDELIQDAARRWEHLEQLQEAYPTFEPFLIDCMEDLMGFTCTDIQVDIGEYLQHGPKHLMVQAQRSQAKSTIVAIYAIWCLIHDPKYRILVISAGSDVAMEIANWAIQIVMSWDILECMRPDRQHGDRASAKAFDINWQLKGAEKSPSIACIGITANMQGRRADLLIPDDIESSKNGMTEIQ